MSTKTETPLDSAARSAGWTIDLHADGTRVYRRPSDGNELTVWFHANGVVRHARTGTGRTLMPSAPRVMEYLRARSARPVMAT